MKTLPTLKSLKDVEILEEMGANIEFDPQEEDISPYDNLEDDAAKEICEQYNNGNMSAWFCAKVTVTYREFEADDYLGCCSYSSFKEFTTTEGDYYQDMINQCVEQINADIEGHNMEIQRIVEHTQSKKFD